MTEALFQNDAYLTECTAKVIESTHDGVVLDRTVFYPVGGGQPGDRGRLIWGSHEMPVIDTRRRRDDGAIVHVPDPETLLPAVGIQVVAEIDWPRRHRLMRMHTCLHLLGAVLKFPVTGGQVGHDKSRLDFDMADSPDKAEVTTELNTLIDAGHPVQSRWIDEEDLDQGLIRTMSVKPPTGVGRIRLLEIPGVDLQPCGGTHVGNTSEIGRVEVTKVEKKGRQNRRVHVVLAGE
ncbi:MAG: alanyl-tRNA editing protein [Wenzhouxiangellaceae bacterium]|nr:alanyl-tRNA editing protein [Wenzhouxiangellaceae bacterium]